MLTYRAIEQRSVLCIGPRLSSVGLRLAFLFRSPSHFCSFRRTLHIVHCTVHTARAIKSIETYRIALWIDQQ